MSVTLHPGRLRLEMTRRGWSAADLARASHLSNATVSTALSGRAVSTYSVALIAKALAQTPPNQIIDGLIFGGGPGTELD